jgi:hypothetical protein
VPRMPHSLFDPRPKREHPQPKFSTLLDADPHYRRVAKASKKVMMPSSGKNVPEQESHRSCRCGCPRSCTARTPADHGVGEPGEVDRQQVQFLPGALAVGTQAEGNRTPGCPPKEERLSTRFVALP